MIPLHHSLKLLLRKTGLKRLDCRCCYYYYCYQSWRTKIKVIMYLEEFV
jgi:hypothetical protein